MEVLIVNQTEVRQVLPMNECIDQMAEALKALTQGNAINPLRHIMWLPEKAGALAAMPAYLGNLDAMGIKVISVIPGNEGTEYDSHQGAVLLFETKHGRPLAIVDASAITAIRTAAASGVATKLLARSDAHDLTLFGAGTQARGHLEAMLLVRDIDRVRVWSLPLEGAHQFAEAESKRHGISIEVIPDPQQAVKGADIICTVTSAPEPVLKGEWIENGAHINAVGSSVPFTRELDTQAVVKSRLFVDRRESTINEAGDFLFPKKEGAITDDHIQAEIGEILTGSAKGRRSAQEITLFKSLGLAIEDLASAFHVYEKAISMGVGTSVELGGSRHSAA